MPKREHVIRFVLSAPAILLVAAALFVFLKWPFTRRREIESLEHFAQSEVTIGHFDKKFFPYPGFDAEQIVFIRRMDNKPVTLAIVAHLECRSRWLNLLTYTNRVSRFDLRGVHVIIPKPIPPSMPFFPERKENTTIEHLSADGTALDVHGIHFAFPQLRLANIGKGKPLDYEVTAQIPKPSSSVMSRGRVGPFQAGPQQSLPLKGSFEIRGGNLQGIEKLAGTIYGRGNFEGVLGHLDISGAANVRSFHLINVPNPVDIASEYKIRADCQHGAVQIEQTTVHFAHTVVYSSGSVADKILTLEIESKAARVEDLLRLVVSAPQPPTAGVIQFHSSVRLPYSNSEFLRRLQMKGEFQIADGELVNARSQRKLDELSARARARKEKRAIDMKEPPHVHIELQANFEDRNGIVTFPAITLKVPSATAAASGTFSLLSSAIALRGTLAMQASLSGAAGGVRSLVLLPLDPFFKKGSAGSVVPIEVSGTYSHPLFKASLRRKRTPPHGT